jgi:YidC/Oxa1 family membrane protein insertase
LPANYLFVPARIVRHARNRLDAAPERRRAEAAASTAAMQRGEPIVRQIEAAGITSRAGIAAELNRRGVRTARGRNLDSRSNRNAARPGLGSSRKAGVARRLPLIRPVMGLFSGAGAIAPSPLRLAGVNCFTRSRVERLLSWPRAMLVGGGALAEPVQFKYRAFLSYSLRDTAWGKWLHRALEAYRIEKDMVGRATPAGPVPAALRPITGPKVGMCTESVGERSPLNETSILQVGAGNTGTVFHSGRWRILRALLKVPGLQGLALSIYSKPARWVQALKKKKRLSASDLSLITLLSVAFLLDARISSAQPMTRDAALAGSPRIAMDSPTVRGSIALKGGRIDDLSLNQYRVTVDPNSPPVVLLSPPGSPHPFYAEVGWVAAVGTTAKLPAADTVWSQEGSGSLGVDQPVTLKWDNGEGLEFRRLITVDDKYLFTIRDEVVNKGTNPISLYPYALVSRHGTPETLGYYILHEGLIGVLGDQGLQEITYSSIEEKKVINYKVTNAWLGITDKYWAATLLPDPAASLHARFSAGQLDSLKTYQTDYLLDPVTVQPGATSTAETRLFVGAKEVSVVDNYDKALHLNRFELLIDWGVSVHYITKPLFMAIDFFFRWTHNYGLAILFVTVLLQLLLFPIANKTYATVAKLRAGKPSENTKVQRIARPLYVAIQLVVQFSLYKILLVTIEMRHAPFFGWIDDLSAPDPTNIFHLFGLMPFDPTTLPVLGSLLHLGIWPAIMCVTMWVLIRLNRAPADPTQKIFFNWMPIIVSYSFAGFATGLVVYRVLNSSLSLLHLSFMIHRYGAKKQLLELKRTFTKPKLARSLADLLRIFQPRSGRASMNVSLGIQIARRIRRASRIMFWLSAVVFSISRSSSSDVLIGVSAMTAVLALVIYLIALSLGQKLAGREFAAALASNPGGDCPIILFLRSFSIARSSLGAKFWVELSSIVRASISSTTATLVGDTAGFVDRRYEVEENLDSAIGLNAMFVAIGDRLASYGAAKITVKEEDWQNTFCRLANASQLIFMMPGPSASLLWELSQILRSPSLLEKTVFIMPRGGKPSLVKAWGMVSDVAAQLGVSFPVYSSQGCYFRLREDGHPSDAVALEPFTRALREFVTSPAYMGMVDTAEVFRLAYAPDFQVDGETVVVRGPLAVSATSTPERMRRAFASHR